MLALVDAQSRIPESDKLAILLSFKAGLRVSEIAKIRVADMTDCVGKPAKTIKIFSGVGKGRRSREIPMHRRVHDALVDFQRKYPTAKHVALARWSDPKRPRSTTPTALTVWFHRLYREVGFEGMSSHSGRRSFGTATARACYANGATLVDVQRILGHRMLSTTEAYVELSDRIHDLLEAI